MANTNICWNTRKSPNASFNRCTIDLLTHKDSCMSLLDFAKVAQGWLPCITVSHGISGLPKIPHLRKPYMTAGAGVLAHVLNGGNQDSTPTAENIY
jgi:hypothetical protein